MIQSKARTYSRQDVTTMQVTLGALTSPLLILLAFASGISLV